MERLTYALGKTNRTYGLVDKASAKVGLFTDYDGFYAHLLATNRLGQYEDTGLSPDEVLEYKKFEDNIVNTYNCDLNHILDLLKKEEQG